MHNLFSAIDTGDQEIIAGNNATISCIVTGITEEMSISWSGFTEEAHFIPNPGTYNSTTNSQTGTLKIGDNATSEDATYTCTVASKLNTESEDKSVEVKLNVYGNVSLIRTKLLVIFSFENSHHYV